MSEFKIIKKDKKGNIEKAAIMGAVAFYTKFQKPSPIYDQAGWANPTQFEWTVELVVDEDTADAYDESVSEKQSSKKLTKEKAAKKYKLVDEDGKIDDEKFKEVGLDPNAKKFFIIKKAQRCQKKDGTPLSSLQPRVVEVVDGKPTDITFEKLVGNGSVVNLMMRYADQGSYGVSSYPAIMKVEKLIEYEQSGNGSRGLDEDDEEFLGGSVEFAEAPSKGSGEESAGRDVSEEMPDFADETADEEDIY